MHTEHGEAHEKGVAWNIPDTSRPHPFSFARSHELPQSVVASHSGHRDELVVAINDVNRAGLRVWFQTGELRGLQDVSQLRLIEQPVGDNQV